MQKKISIGVIGAGFGQQVHVPAFRADPRCEVVAICASRLEKAETATRLLNIPRAFDDWRELINAPGIDAVSIALPPALQAEVAIAAAQAGKHIFCEKPLALNVAQARQILEAAENKHVAHALDFIFSEVPAFQMVRERLRSAEFGRIRHIILTWQVETFTYRMQTTSWKMESEAGGGTLNNFVSHSLYYLEWLFGPIVRLNAFFSPSHKPVEARVDIWVEFAAGCSGSITVAADAFLGSGHRIEVYGDANTLVLENKTADYVRGFTLLAGNRNCGKLASIELPPENTGVDGRISAVSRIARRFVDTLESGGTASPNLHDGLRVQVLIDAVRQAATTGVWQMIAEK